MCNKMKNGSKKDAHVCIYTVVVCVCLIKSKNFEIQRIFLEKMKIYSIST